jgi:O-antigen ligase
MMVGVTVVLYLHADSKRVRRFLLVGIGVLLVGIGATSSRTGFVMLAVLGLFIAVASVRQLPRALPLVGILVLGTIGIAVAAPTTPRLILDFFTGRVTDNSVDVRLNRTDSIPELLAERPIVGAGYLTGDPNVVLFDNAYFTQLIELGVLGLALLVAFLLAIMVRCYGALAIAPDSERPLLLAGVIAGISLLVASATYDAFSFDQFLPACVLIMGVGIARADVLRRADRVSEVAQRS